LCSISSLLKTKKSKENGGGGKSPRTTKWGILYNRRREGKRGGWGGNGLRGGHQMAPEGEKVWSGVAAKGGGQDPGVRVHR